MFPLQRNALAYYGDPRDPKWYAENVVRVPCPWPLHIGSTPTYSIAIHRKLKESLSGVLKATWDKCGGSLDKIMQLRYDRYSGSYNFRPKRGGASLSMHAYAAAIDFDAGDNAFHSQHHLFNQQSPLVVAFIEAGWVWGGDWSPGSIDAMHFQAARIHA